MVSHSPLKLTAENVLRKIAEGREHELALGFPAAISLFGTDKAGELFRANRHRAPETTKRIRNTAADMINKLGVAAGASDGVDVAAALDAWLAMFVHARTGSIPVDGLSVVSPGYVETLTGGLLLTIGSVMPGFEAPLFLEAKKVCGCADRRKAGAHRTKRSGIMPHEVWEYLMTPTSSSSPREEMLRAALALACVASLPVGMTAAIETSDISFDDFRGVANAAFVCGYGGKRKVKRHLRPNVKSSVVVWFAAANPMIARFVFPWWLKAHKAGFSFLFPQPQDDYGSGEGVNFKASMVSPTTLQRFCEETFGPGRAWHGLRVGCARAVDFVHLISGSEPIGEAVKNVIQCRSNKSLRGSRDVYIKDACDPCWEATWDLHLVRLVQRGGMFRLAKDDDEESHDSDQSDVGSFYFVDCGGCGFHMGRGSPGALCDEEGCGWGLCLECWPHETSLPLRCPAHCDADKADAEDDLNSPRTSVDGSTGSVADAGVCRMEMGVNFMHRL